MMNEIKLADIEKELNTKESIKKFINDLGWEVFEKKPKDKYTETLLGTTFPGRKKIFINNQKQELHEYILLHEIYHLVNREFGNSMMGSNVELEKADIFAYRISTAKGFKVPSEIIEKMANSNNA